MKEEQLSGMSWWELEMEQLSLGVSLWELEMEHWSWVCWLLVMR